MCHLFRFLCEFGIIYVIFLLIIMNEIILAPDAPMLMESTRSIGYSLKSAIADVIDNSVAAEAKEIKINYRSNENPFISIFDNGKGMSSDELTNAMQYACKSINGPRDENDLGRFGLGLKTASLSQCRVLSVFSKKDNVITGRRWDLDKVIETNNWTLLDLDLKEIENVSSSCIEEFNRCKSGTIVLWQNLDKIVKDDENFKENFSKLMNEVYEHLALVFHRLINDDKTTSLINMFINENRVFPKDPYYEERSTKPKPDESIKIYNSIVKIRTYLLPHLNKLKESERKILDVDGRGLRSNQGFYIYRNKRLIVWGTWFNIIKKTDTSLLARIRVDIPNSMDHLWSLDIKKSEATPPPQLKKRLVKYIESIAELSKRTWTFRGRREYSKNTIPLWARNHTASETVFYSINPEHPVIKKMYELCQENEKEMQILLSQISENIPINQIQSDLQGQISVKSAVDFTEEDIIEKLWKLSEMFSDVNGKKNFILSLKNSFPFNNFPEAIEKVISELG